MFGNLEDSINKDKIKDFTFALHLSYDVNFVT